ncbi:hypothetical protein H5T53_05460 [Candidatus Bipolaricaulota bacterium]|nr:hypothetical protein [Candidatus Bipolaricaulota bacterium]
MAAGKKAVVVALAAMVAAFPAFAQVTVAEAAPGEDLLLALPQGEELTDLELAAIHGERTDIELGGGGGGLGPILWWAAQKAWDVAKTGVVEFGRLVGELGKKVADLAVRGATFTAVKATQHPLVRDMTLGGVSGFVSSVVTAAKNDEPLTLKDVGFATLVGAGIGASTHGVVRGLEELARRGGP